MYGLVRNVNQSPCFPSHLANDIILTGTMITLWGSERLSYKPRILTSQEAGEL